ncbi:MAG TPA: hypothetical protein VGV61_02710 [Thermoanaerobaculia bacterium]|nr:hypothetical protein [Thermoanaerobaculia bacterium]
MKSTPLVLVLILALAPPSLAAASPSTDLPREVALTRDLIEDAGIRFDDEGLRLGRERAARLAAAAEAAGDVRVARDAHYLIALAVYAQVYTGHNDFATLERIAKEGVLHADRAAALDDKFADAQAMAGADRFAAFMYAGRAPEMRTAALAKLQQAMKIDPTSTPGVFFDALGKSIDPAGPARPAGVAAYGDLVKKSDARLSAGEPVLPGFWDVEVRAWYAIVRLQQLQPEAPAIRADLEKLLALRPDSAMARELMLRVEHRSWAPAAAVTGLAWRPLGSDPVGDGKVPGAPELRSLDLARGADRVWFRLNYEQALPPSFGANVVIDRDGDPSGDAKWWGGASSFRYDRLVTAWIVREGDGYFGVAGVSDSLGASTQRMMQLGTDVLLRLGDDHKSLVIGVPASVLDLATGAKVLAAGGTNLIWNDNLTAEGGAGIEIPAQ